MTGHPPRDLDEALDALGPDGGSAEIADPRGHIEVEASEVDRLGVRIEGVRIRFQAPRDVARECERLPGDLRELGEAVAPVEVDPVLGGGILRTRPDDMRDREYFEVGVRPDRAEIRRYRVGADGGRERADWTLTRDQLRRLIDGICGD